MIKQFSLTWFSQMRSVRKIIKAGVKLLFEFLYGSEFDYLSGEL